MGQRTAGVQVLAVSLGEEAVHVRRKRARDGPVGCRRDPLEDREDVNERDGDGLLVVVRHVVSAGLGEPSVNVYARVRDHARVVTNFVLVCELVRALTEASVKGRA